MKQVNICFIDICVYVFRTAKKTVKRSVRSSSSIQAKAIYAKEKKSESGNVTFMTRPTA